MKALLLLVPILAGCAFAITDPAADPVNRLPDAERIAQRQAEAASDPRKQRYQPLSAQELPPAEKTGTGFAVLSKRTLITAFHVIDGARTIEVACGVGASAPGSVEKVDPANDLALIFISTPAPGYLEMSVENSLKVGQKVFTMGFPVPDVLGYEAKYSEGVISSLSGIQGAVSLIQTTVPIQPGNSGGPLSDDSGHVVGVVTSTAAVQSFLKHTGTLPQNINWAVKSEYLHPLLSGITQDPPYVAASPIERVQKSVCLIKAYNK